MSDTTPKPSPPAPTGGQECEHGRVACPKCRPGSYPPPPDVEEAQVTDEMVHGATNPVDLPPEAARVLNENLWNLYDAPAPSAEPTSGEDYSWRGREASYDERIAALEQENARLAEEYQRALSATGEEPWLFDVPSDDKACVAEYRIRWLRVRMRAEKAEAAIAAMTKERDLWITRWTEENAVCVARTNERDQQERFKWEANKRAGQAEKEAESVLQAERERVRELEQLARLVLEEVSPWELGRDLEERLIAAIQPTEEPGK